jgi:hypothetical protein
MPIKKTQSKDSNRIRFIMLDADISDGNLTELTHAITSALKSGSNTPLRQIPPQLQVKTLSPADEAEEEEQPVDAEITEDNEGAPAPSKPARPRKAKPPDYLPELLAGEKGAEFKTFAAEKNPTSRSKQYLVASYWLKEHGDSPTVNADKIYTCFKTAGWPTGFNNFDQPFRNLVHSDHMRKMGAGEFAINPLGEDVINKPETALEP